MFLDRTEIRIELTKTRRSSALCAISYAANSKFRANIAKFPRPRSHSAFVSTAPTGPGISGAFNFSIFKALLKAMLSRAKIMVKSLLKAPTLPGLTIMKNNKLPESVELTFLAYPIVIPHKLWLHWSCGFREKFEHTHIHRHIHTFTRKPLVFKKCTCLPNTTAESCSR